MSEKSRSEQLQDLVENLVDTGNEAAYQRLLDSLRESPGDVKFVQQTRANYEQHLAAMARIAAKGHAIEQGRAQADVQYAADVVAARREHDATIAQIEARRRAALAEYKAQLIAANRALIAQGLPPAPIPSDEDLLRRFAPQEDE